MNLGCKEFHLIIICFSLFSGRFLIEKEFQSLLGGIEHDQKGQIIFARAIEFKIIGYMNGTAAKMQEIQADSALGEYVSKKTFHSNGILFPNCSELL
jgi:hypothetical protein